MGAKTKRVRDNNGDLTTLDLTDATAANRRLEVDETDLPQSCRLIEIRWTKSTAEAADVQVYKVDGADSDELYLQEERLGDTGTSGVWRPPEEDLTGLDVDDPSEEGQIKHRIQFGQTSGACVVHALIVFKEV